MSDNNFWHLASQTMDHIVAQIELYDENLEFDLDYHDGIINMNTPEGDYVINIHSSAQEIWLASPVSGPSHYKYHDNNWLCTRTRLNLFKRLEDELSPYLNLKF